MDRYCIPCKYGTNKKYNFDMHCKSKKHELNVSDHKETHLTCLKCGKQFTRKYNLDRHSIKCVNVTCQKLFNAIDKLKEENNMLKNKNEKNGKAKNKKADGTNVEYMNVNINSTNPLLVIQQYFKNPPELKPIKDYTLEDDIIVVEYHHRNKTLPKYIGDTIVAHYKKDDPEEQALWVSDASRLTFILARMLKDKEMVWTKDLRGNKCKKIIVANILGAIHEAAGEYLKNNLLAQEGNFDRIMKENRMLMNLGCIQKEIEDGVMSDNVLKYIAPYFTLSNNETLALQ